MALDEVMLMRFVIMSEAYRAVKRKHGEKGAGALSTNLVCTRPKCWGRALRLLRTLCQMITLQSVIMQHSANWSPSLMTRRSHYHLHHLGIDELQHPVVLQHARRRF